MTLPLYHISLPMPPIGNKIFHFQQPGIYVLERGACMWQAMANTRQGSSSLSVYDALPDDKGMLPDDAKLNFNASPAILGMWMFGAGFHNGLTIVAHDNNGPVNASPSVTVTWMLKKDQARKIENVK